MNNQKYQHILVDVMNLYHRAYYKSSHLTTRMSSGEVLVTGGIYTSLRMIEKLRKDYLLDSGIMYFLFEGSLNSSRNLPLLEEKGSRSHRSEIDPEYKSGRRSRDPEFYRGVEYLQLILLAYDDDFVIADIPDVEADDLVLPIVDGIPSDEMILLNSTDLDWARSIRANVHWFSNKGIYDEERFQEEYGFPPHNKKLQLYKAFRGDKSDNIPKGVASIREAILVQLVQDYDTLNDIFHNLDQIDYLSDTWKQRIEENKARLRLNYRLVDFYPIDATKMQEHMFACQFQPSFLRSFYELLGFNIPELDPRIPPKENKGPYIDEFFQQESVPRA